MKKKKQSTQLKTEFMIQAGNVGMSEGSDQSYEMHYLVLSIKNVYVEYFETSEMWSPQIFPTDKMITCWKSILKVKNFAMYDVSHTEFDST